MMSSINIHPTAIVSPKAKVGIDVKIGAFCIIYDNVDIGDNTVIEPYCEIGVANNLSDGEVLKIGKNSHIRSHSVFYEASHFGEQLVTGHRVTVREKTIAGKNLQIGTLSDIQGHCEIGDYVRFHSNVHVGQYSKICDFVWIFPYVVLTNDPHPPSDVMQGVTVKNYAAIATMSVILPGTVIEEGVLVGAHSSVKGITEANMVYVGNPAKKVCETSKIKRQDGSDLPAYPWYKHFHRGYPKEIINNWKIE